MSRSEEPDIARESGHEELLKEFECLVATHHSRLYRYILKLENNRDDAADLTQQTFIDAFRSLANFRGQASLSTWLFGIGLNLARNYRSRSPVRRYPHCSIDEILQISGPDDPEQTASDRQQVRRLNAALQELSSEMRETIVLICLEELSYEDAAAALGVPIGTVRSRLSRARTQLRALLSRQANP